MSWGSQSSIATESISMPRNVRQVVGPTDLGGCLALCMSQTGLFDLLDIGRNLVFLQ